MNITFSSPQQARSAWTRISRLRAQLRRSGSPQWQPAVAGTEVHYKTNGLTVTIAPKTADPVDEAISAAIASHTQGN